MKKISVYNGPNYNPNFTDRIIIEQYPLAVAPTLTLVGSAAGGSLLNGNTYFYAVQSIGANGESKISNEVSQAIIDDGNNSVSLTWTSVPGLEIFRLFVGTQTGVYDGYIEIHDIATPTPFVDLGTTILKQIITPVPTDDPISVTTSLRKSEIKEIVPIFFPATVINDLEQDAVSKLELIKTIGTAVTIDLRSVVNQSTWNLGTQVATMTAKADLDDWIL